MEWDENPAVYIAHALSPAKVISVDVDENEKMSRVVVPDNQLSLAIGKEGQNARLAAKLTGWKIDIKSESQAQEEEVAAPVEDDLADDILAELGQDDDFQQENAAPEEVSQPADVEPNEEA